MRVLALAVLVLLTGCVDPQRQAAIEAAQARAQLQSREREARAQRFQMAEASAKSHFEACQDRLRRGELKTRVEAIRCSNPNVVAGWQEAGWPYMDLIHLMAAARMVGAERVDRGEATDGQVELDFSELRVRVSSEIRRRDLEVQQLALQRASVANQQRAVQAQAQAADAASTAALLQGLATLQALGPRTTTCFRGGIVTSCTTR